MANRDPKETLLSWLNDAYAMEKGLVQVLENHAADVKDRPEMYRKISEHLEKTRMHAQRVEQCVERLGGSVSTVKTALGTVAGFIHGRTTEVAPDEIIKNALSDYAAEHLEIASYKALIVAARSLGETEVARVCEEILRDEEDMAHWLDQNLPIAVQEYLGQHATVGAGMPSTAR